MDDVITSVQGGGTERQHEVLDGTVQALKWIFPSLPGETKDSASVKKTTAGEGNWTCMKEILGWLIEMEAGTVSLSDQ